MKMKLSKVGSKSVNFYDSGRIHGYLEEKIELPFFYEQFVSEKKAGPGTTQCRKVGLLILYYRVVHKD